MAYLSEKPVPFDFPGQPDLFPSLQGLAVHQAAESPEIFRQFVGDVVEKIGEKVDEADLKQVAAVVLAATLTLGLVPPVETNVNKSPVAERISDLAGADLITHPKDIKINYFVPESTPKVKDLAYALDMKAEDVAQQVSEQLHTPIIVGDKLPAGKTIKLDSLGTVYETQPADTPETICKQFGVLPNVLKAANPQLANKSFVKPLEGTQVIIPKQVSIVRLPKQMKLEDALSIPAVADILPNVGNRSLNSVNKDAGSLGNLLVIQTNELNTDTDKSDVSFTSILGDKESKSSVNATPEKLNENISPEVQRVNTALDKIKINGPNDLSELVQGIIEMDKAFRPYDKDRLPGTPDGIVKMMLAHEAIGINVDYVPSERTADVERYDSPQMFAVFLASAKLLKDYKVNYPELKGSMLRMRDGNAPAHATHNNGTYLDISSAIGFEVSQYADGPVGDYQFSNTYNEKLNVEMLIDMARFTINGQNAIKRVLTSSNSLITKVNNGLGYIFMRYSKWHDDHWHTIGNPAFAQPQWRPRLSDLPWSEIQDLKIGSLSQPISAEQHNSQHEDFENYIANRNLGQKVELEKQIHENFTNSLNEVLAIASQHEGGWDSFNHGKAGDAGGNFVLNDGRKITDLTISEIMELQNRGLFAVGRWQIIPTTLRSAIQATGIDTNRKFDELAQTEIATNYLLFQKQPVLAAYLNGSVKYDNPLEAANSMAKEWASLPYKFRNGVYKSFYSGVGNNSAPGGKKRFHKIMEALSNLRNAKQALDNINKLGE